MRSLPLTALLVALVLGQPTIGHSQFRGSLQPHPSSLRTAAELPFHPTIPHAAALNVSPRPAAAYRRTHWVDGAVVGAVVTGLFSGLLLNGLCQATDEAHHGCTGASIGGTAVGALVGGTIGALLGGIFPKE